MFGLVSPSIGHDLAIGAAGLQALHGLVTGGDLASVVGALWIYPPLLSVSAIARLLMARRAT